MMKFSTLFIACLSFIPSMYAEEVDVSELLRSRQILPTNFKPPQVFKNVNSLRTINLEKGYVKETVNVVIQNIDTKPQGAYYIPFGAEIIGKVGGFEVRDKKDPNSPPFLAENIAYDALR